MIDEPGPWGTGPFTLVQGASSILTRHAVMSPNPYTASWLIESEDRSAEVVLEANLDHWNRAERGPRVQRAVFRNDLSPSQALELCISGDGEVDIVTEVSPADAERVRTSQYARLITADANRVLTCIINRGRTDVPLDSVDVRKALNLAVDRRRIVEDGLAGYANEIPAMTPSWCSGFPEGATPYPHDPDEAKRLFEKGGWPTGRPIRIATPMAFVGIAQLIGDDLRRSLGVAVEVIRVPEENALAGSRALVEKKLDLPWDLLVHAWFDLSSEAPPAAVHREFFGRDGAFRAGPPDPGFDELFARMAVELDGARLVRVAEDIDRYCFDNALAVFLCAPQALYAVNNHVSFGPYRTTFEIAEVTVDEGHWSRQPDMAQPAGPGSPPADAANWDKPGFAGAAGNAC
ncbi:peptide/nickel transport system substrate-binding protein [Pseudonocardia hierapolitana]|uniref:Peptide/nickel transport system substrate-binding protein n=1 Tax=Pseudonocardia hierapolitana TaxID=1128676 RepID=A0A561SLJ8_9PSEU|nr:ABC transporter substrate-binding protein [Pseudonocardia hierapolitana]TWF75740.1 peptide/nickel transport system substrate-binding protein [Pseudonocardia hierapolitana]